MLTTGLGVVQLGGFLRSRRAGLTPCAVGLPDVSRRRTAGLHREEVAQLAGISPAWYTHLEQGRDVHPSRNVLGGIADALRLDATERAYLFQLAYGPRHDVNRRAPAAPILSTVQLASSPAALDGTPPSLRRLLDAPGPTPALVIDRCWDLVGCTTALAAMLPNFDPARLLNLVEYVLTNLACRAAMRDWAGVARMAVDVLRASLAGVEAGDPAGDRPATLVARLNATSPEFRAWWPAHGLWVADRPVTHVDDHPTWSGSRSTAPCSTCAARPG